MGHVSYENTADAIYDPHDAKFWDESSLNNELARVFDLCNGCRMCFKFCPSFPSLFEAVDRTDNDVFKLTQADKDKVVDECFQCKLCYVNCPYTATDEHKYNVDYPALMQRYRMIDTKKNGLGLREKVLQNPDLAGKANTGLISGVVNWALNNNFHRKIAQAILGIHKDKRMPAFHRTSFSRWFKKHRARLEKEGGGIAADPAAKVVLFSTCFVNYNNPRVGKDAVDVLEKNNVRVECPSQNCCGMPGLDTGDIDFAVKKMEKNIASLYPYAEQGYKILAINPTCSLTLKKEYPNFMPPGELREKARVISKATRDLHEFLFELKQEEKLNRDFKSSPGKVAYHVPCHLRMQNIGFRSRDIMKLIPGTKIAPVAECCGHDGTFAMKEEFFEMSMKTGKKSFDALKAAGGDQVATDCPLAAIQLQQGMDLDEAAIHPIQVLARAYKSPEAGGWEHPAVKPEE